MSSEGKRAEEEKMMGMREREKGRQIKWSEKCPHERELAPSSSWVGVEGVMGGFL